MYMGESSKIPKSETFKIPILKLEVHVPVCPLTTVTILSLNGQFSFDRLTINQRPYYNLPNSAF